MSRPHQPTSFTEGLKPGDSYTSSTTHVDGSSDSSHVDLSLDGGYNENLTHIDAIGDSSVYQESSHNGETDYSLGHYNINGHSDYQELDQHANGSADTYQSAGQHYGPGEFHGGFEHACTICPPPLHTDARLLMTASVGHSPDEDHSPYQGSKRG